ncbi:MAG: VCBS repeat-containing protein [Verrucomicrobiales bacterium]|nr:VCBS repeat-containing protein [Verrucomicrobiales bacterium]
MKTRFGQKLRLRNWLGTALVMVVVALLTRDRGPARITPMTSPVAVAPALTPSNPTSLSPERRAFQSQLARRANSPEALPIPTAEIVQPPIVNERRVVIEPDLRTQLRELAAEGIDPTVRLPALWGDDFQITVTRHEAQDGRQGAIVGELAGKPGSQVILGYADEAVAGTVFDPDRGLFQVRYLGNGQHRVVELDPARFPPDGPPALPAIGPVPAPAPAPASLATVSALGPSSTVLEAEPGPAAMLQGDPLPEAPVPYADLAQGDGASVPGPVAGDVTVQVDVMVVYTAACATANGGASGMTALINASVTSANTAYSNSHISQSLRLVYSGQITYTSSGQLGTDLSRLRTTGDGIMDTAHTLRDQYKADLVSLFVTGASDYAGIAYLWMPGYAPSAVAPNGFSVVVDVYADSNLTFAHELGHNMGCGHAASDGGSGAYSYSYGHKFTANNTSYRTVMAYAPGIRLPYFSSPSYSYLGTTLGTSTANNTLTIQNSGSSVSAFRVGSTVQQDWTLSGAVDLTADEKPDLYWRNLASGRVISWAMDGISSQSTATLWAASSPGDSAWVPVGAGDFNADTKPDMVWRNTTSGRVVLWYMDGTTRTSTAVIWPITSAADALWVPMATGDFNADGKQDLIWRYSPTGRVIVWYMDGATRTGTANLWPATAAGDSLWVPVATADLNADGKTDILWRNSSTGRVIVWMMNGVTRTSTVTLWAASAAGDSLWVPMATGDFNADGKPDILWRNSSTGRVIVWYLNGTTTTSTATVWGS